MAGSPNLMQETSVASLGVARCSNSLGVLVGLRRSASQTTLLRSKPARQGPFCFRFVQRQTTISRTSVQGCGLKNFRKDSTWPRKLQDLPQPPCQVVNGRVEAWQTSRACPQQPPHIKTRARARFEGWRAQHKLFRTRIAG